MKKTSKFFLASAAAVLALASCNRMPIEGVDSFTGDEIRFSSAVIFVNTKAFTEATNTILQTNGFNAAAIIDSDNSTMFNTAVTYSSGAYTVPNTKYYWPVSGTMSFYGVYPKTQAITLNSGDATLSYSHDTDTDLIAAKAAGVSKQSSAVMMTFDHILSQVQIKAQGAETTVDYKVFSVKITDADGGTYAYTAGTWTPSSTTQAYTVYSNASGMEVSTSTMTAVGSAMSFVPGDAKLQVVWKCYNKGTSTVVCEKDVTVDVTLPQGKNSTLNLTLPFDASNLTFNSSIGAWVSDIQNIEMEEPYTPELINGVFTVNNSNQTVKFVKGNLFWNGSEFRCEDTQYAYPTTGNADHIGHFSWSKDARVAYAENYNIAIAGFGITPATTDKFFAADGGAIEGFTVLSKDEWNYLINNAIAKNSSSNNEIIIDGKKCLVLKPDGFSGAVYDSYNAAQWATAEASGLVALPFAGSSDASIVEGTGFNGNYWSSTPGGDYADIAWYAYFNDERAYTDNFNRNLGYSVRLVSVQ